jgi:hypothetical protein
MATAIPHVLQVAVPQPVATTRVSVLDANPCSPWILSTINAPNATSPTAKPATVLIYVKPATPTLSSVTILATAPIIPNPTMPTRLPASVLATLPITQELGSVLPIAESLTVFPAIALPILAVVV